MHQPLQTDKTAERLARFNSRLQQSAGSSLLVHTREQWQLRDGLALEDSISGLAAITCSRRTTSTPPCARYRLATLGASASFSAARGMALNRRLTRDDLVAYGAFQEYVCQPFA